MNKTSTTARTSKKNDEAQVRTIAAPAKKEEGNNDASGEQIGQSEHENKPLKYTTSAGGENESSRPTDAPRNRHIRIKNRRLYRTRRHATTRNNRTEPGAR